MLGHYLRIVFRSLWKNKGFSFINILGLSIGMACSLLIFLFVKDEISYDRFHSDADRIHRVVKDFINDDGSRIPDATSPSALAPAMQREIPEIANATRVFPSWGSSYLVTYGDKKISEPRIFLADSSFFHVFDFPFVQGNPRHPFPDNQSILITVSAAKRYFGNENPMGKHMNIDNMGDVVVAGVLQDIPSNAHFHFDFLGSIRQFSNLDTDWGRYNYYTYVKLKENTDASTLGKKIQGVYERNQEERISKFYTQPLTSIHLNSHLKWEIEPNSDKLYVYVFSIIGLFILLIAAINYINLATAKSALRAKEIGIRKVSGAVRSSLIGQFLLESVVTCLLAAILAMIIAHLLTPMVNLLTKKDLDVSGDPATFIYVLIAVLLIGLVAGLIPALYLSSFKPIMVLKGFKLNERGALNLRKSLVVIQFTISIVLIAGALIIAQQMKFIQSTRLGFDKEQVLVINNAGYLSSADRSALQNDLKKIPAVKKVSTASNSLGNGFSTTRLSPKGSDKEQQVNFMMVGLGYMDVLGMEIKEGRGFSEKFPGDTLNNGIPGGPLEQNLGSVILNETAVRDLGLGTPAVGRQLVWARDLDTTYYVTVVGVMKDFHFTSLRNEIKPFASIPLLSNQNNFTVKLSTSNLSQTLAQLEGIWKKFTSERPFEYSFLDETFSKLYDSEARFQKIFIALVVLGILIACLGLLGLATYAAQQRVKEIGIRKTLGASVSGIVALLSKDFLKLVLISIVIAIPIAWYAMNLWLEDFAYRISIQWWVFVLAGMAAILIAFATISIQTFRAARTNPVKSLRTE